MKIWKRIILGFISIIMIMMIVDFNALWNNIRIINQVDELELSKRVELNQANKISYDIQRIKSNIRELFLEVNAGVRDDEIERAIDVIETNIPELEKSVKTLKEATLVEYDFSDEEDENKFREANELIRIDSLQALTRYFSVSIKQLITLQHEHKHDEAEDLFEYSTEPISREIQELLEIMVRSAEEEVAWAIEQLDESVEKAIRLGIYLTILSILLSMGIGLYISRSISNPLDKLIISVREITKGNLDSRVKFNTKDELQLLADSFNNMAEELKTKISAINNINKELIESNNTKDTFFSIIAHDLKNPFNVILGYADLLTNQYHDFDEEKRQNLIREIDRSSKNTYELLENLLTWARAQSGKLQIKKETLAIEPIIAKSIESYRSNAEQKNIQIIKNIAPEIKAKADRFMLSVILNNIINNAVKFTPENGKIEIYAEALSKVVELRIKDSGIGMSKKTVGSILSSEENVSNPGTNSEKGTGLGMVLIKDFIKKNDGLLRIESEPGKGSEFTVILPV